MERQAQPRNRSPEECDTVLIEEVDRGSVERDLREILGEDTVDKLEPEKLQALIDAFVWTRVEDYVDSLIKLTVEGGARGSVSEALMEPVADSLHERIRRFTDQLQTGSTAEDSTQSED